MTISQRANFSLSALSVALGVVIALSTLTWGPWDDEFWTLASTARGLTVHEFLANMYQDQHPILYYGLIYLAQAVGIGEIVALRSLNFLGLALAATVLLYTYRQKSINPTQIMLVAVLYASSPIFLSYFSELRGYFILYSASISISILWLLVAQRANGARPTLSSSMIAAWGVCLAIFVNLHYFATIFGGILTLALLVMLARRRLWRLAFVIAAVSLAASAPALLLGALQATFSLSGQMNWITTNFREAVHYTIRIVDYAVSSNIPAIACAAVTGMLLLEDRKLRERHRNVVILVLLAAVFFGMMVGLNAVVPMIWDRYLISAAGAVTVATAFLAAGANAPKWMPAATAAVAIVVQLYAIGWLEYTGRGFIPIASAIAQTKLVCETTKVFAVIPSQNAAMRHIGFQYYGKRFNFQITEITSKPPQAIAGGACPSLVWIWGTQRDVGSSATQLIRDYNLPVSGNPVLQVIDGQFLLTIK
jgi:hypothetical protein